jgi:hypothetical protein
MRSCGVALILLAGCLARTTSSNAPAPSHPVSIGRDGPLVVGRVDPQGRWVFYCQVQRDTDGDGEVWGGASNHGLVGDAFEPRLWLYGTELALDGFLDASRDGRWLATREGGTAWLRDVQTGTRTELPIAAAGDPYSFAPRAEIVGDGTRILYVRDEGEVVLRELATGRQTVRRAPAGKVWRAWLDGDGEHVWADIVVADTDGDGAIAVPRADTNLVVGDCRSSAATSTWGGWYGDAPVLHVGLDDGTFAPMAGGIAFFDGGVLARTSTGALVVRRGEASTVIAPEACGARIVRLDRARGRVWYACDADAEEVRTRHDEYSYSIHRWAPMHLWDQGASRSLGTSIDAPEVDWLDHVTTVTTRDGSELDLETGMPPPDPPHHVLVVHDGRGLVILRDGTPCMEDLETRRRECFAGDERVDPTFYASEMRVAGGMVLTPIGDHRGALLDLDASRVLGFVPDREQVHAVDARGRLLVGEPTGLGVIDGPLRWDDALATVAARRREATRAGDSSSLPRMAR